MSADLVERFRTDMLGAVAIGRPIYADEVHQWANWFAAEIVRLRGDNLRQANAMYADGMASELMDIAPAEAKDPAPAMPNGVGAADVHLAAEMLTWGREEGLTVKQEAEVAAHAEKLFRLLRAADNRDAAGVDSEEDVYVIERMGKLLAEIAVIVNGPEPDMTRWSYHDLPEKVRALKTTPAAVPAGEAVAYSVVQVGNRGAAYDPPNTHRAFTYEHQPGNIDASRLGRATNAAAVASAGDSIDRGLSLLKELQALGFGVFQIGPPAPVQAAPQEGEAEALARKFHDTYERLAPSFGYETRQETRRFDPTTPNGRLMIAVCAELAANPSACELGAVRDGYYLASFKQSRPGHPVLWWAPDNRGYTTDLRQAGIYTEIDPGYHDSEYTVPVPVAFVQSLRIRHEVDPGDSANTMFWSAEKLRAALQHRGDSRGGES